MPSVPSTDVRDLEIWKDYTATNTLFKRKKSTSVIDALEIEANALVAEPEEKHSLRLVVNSV